MPGAYSGRAAADGNASRPLDGAAPDGNTSRALDGAAVDGNASRALDGAAPDGNIIAPIGGRGAGRQHIAVGAGHARRSTELTPK